MVKRGLTSQRRRDTAGQLEEGDKEEDHPFPKTRAPRIDPKVGHRVDTARPAPSTVLLRVI